MSWWILMSVVGQGIMGAVVATSGIQVVEESIVAQNVVEIEKGDGKMWAIHKLLYTVVFHVHCSHRLIVLNETSETELPLQDEVWSSELQGG